MILLDTIGVGDEDILIGYLMIDSRIVQYFFNTDIIDSNNNGRELDNNRSLSIEL